VYLSTAAADKKELHQSTTPVNVIDIFCVYIIAVNCGACQFLYQSILCRIYFICLDLFFNVGVEFQSDK